MAKDKERHIELIARTAMVREGCVLLCRNVKGGYYFLPGGHVEFGEPAAAAAARELVEEAGIEVEVGSLALVTEGAFEEKGKRHHEVNLVFHVEPSPKQEGQWGESRQQAGDAPPLPPVPSLESALAFEWVDLAAVVSVDVRPEGVRAWLATLGRSGPTEATAEWVSEVPTPPLSAATTRHPSD